MADIDREIPFRFFAETSFFEKASEPEGKRRRVAGVISTEEEDQQGETIVQRGIDFSYFLEKGYFNDHHDKTIAGIVGYPESVRVYRKGDTLPNGERARANLTWCEGRLLENDPRADAIWKKAQALEGTDRRLGFSVEGSARLRSDDGKTILKSVVTHCAVTHKPVNAGTTASVFLKALVDVEAANPAQLDRAWDAFAKALSMGEPSPPPVSPEPKTGEGAARVMSRRDEPRAKRKRRARQMTKAQAIDAIVDRYPGMTKAKAARVLAAILARRTQRSTDR